MMRGEKEAAANIEQAAKVIKEVEYLRDSTPKSIPEGERKI